MSGADNIGVLPYGGMLPWGARKDRLQYPPTVTVDTDIKTGEFVMRTLFAEFTCLSEKKIDMVMAEPLVSFLSTFKK